MAAIDTGPVLNGLVFNIQHYSLHDGPGIRSTVFLKGCPLSCAWCHNPESRTATPELRWIQARCINCGQCIEVCPERIQAAVTARESGCCTTCGSCVAACPTGAREIMGREMSLSQVVDEVLRDRIFLDQSHGGVTISGGEPLAQSKFTHGLLNAFREQAVHTALDTCGFAPTPRFLEVATAADLVLYDIKVVDADVHRAYTGVSNELILANLQELARVHSHVWVRIPLIPGFNLDPGSLADLAHFVASIGGIRQVNLLPYHEMGRSKSSVNGQANGGMPTHFEKISESQVQRAVGIFRAAGITTLVGG